MVWEKQEACHNCSTTPWTGMFFGSGLLAHEGISTYFRTVLTAGELSFVEFDGLLDRFEGFDLAFVPMYSHDRGFRF